MQLGKVWASVEFVVGLALLGVGLGAHFALHAADPRLLILAPFGAGLLLSDALTRLAKFAVTRASERRGSVR